MRPTSRLIWLVLLALAGSGCVNHVYSPPARTLPLESVATLRPERQAIAIEGSAHGAMFGPSLESGTLRYRHGVVPGLEVEAEGTAMVVDQASSATTNPMIYAGRVGFKHDFGRFFAVTGGVGGGLDAAGPFFSPDMGAIVAWENPYLVPFLSARGTLSIPIAPRAVDTSQPDDPPGTQMSTPQNTGALNVTLGVRVPIGRTPKQGLHGSFALGLGFTDVTDWHQDLAFVSSGVNVELDF